MGDQKPSEFYRSLLLLSGHNLDPDLVKRLWIKKLPKNLSVPLTCSNAKDINELVKLADNIWEVPNPTEVHAVATTSNDANTLTLHNLLKSQAKLCESMNTLTLEVNAMKAQMSHQRFISRARSRSRSRGRLNSRNNQNWLCRYHYRFGSKARKCEQPCSYKKSAESTN